MHTIINIYNIYNTKIRELFLISHKIKYRPTHVYIHTRIFLKDSVTVYHYIYERTLSSKILYEIRTTPLLSNHITST